ncbi:hypothetical protein [Conexibacter sp. SYSU D00693]|uniref:hypothetical protein n=1 Tax=Conexibacter sp. SYSU D00693 TaxID=2812560 RepID=UPI00196A4A8A|nr:hypothetical protein [Conexibacter sp. SYSU D00693]
MRKLSECQACGAPFVVPVELLDIVDEGLYLVALHCTSCDDLAVDELEDAELEALDHHLAETTEQMRLEADGLAAGLDVRI